MRACMQAHTVHIVTFIQVCIQYSEYSIYIYCLSTIKYYTVQVTRMQVTPKIITLRYII